MFPSYPILGLMVLGQAVFDVGRPMTVQCVVCDAVKRVSSLLEDLFLFTRSMRQYLAIVTGCCASSLLRRHKNSIAFLWGVWLACYHGLGGVPLFGDIG